MVIDPCRVAKRTVEHTAKSSITQPVMMLSIKEPQDSSIHSKIVASKPFEPIFRQGQIYAFCSRLIRLNDSQILTNEYR